MVQGISTLLKLLQQGKSSSRVDKRDDDKALEENSFALKAMALQSRLEASQRLSSIAKEDMLRNASIQREMNNRSLVGSQQKNLLDENIAKLEELNTEHENALRILNDEKIQAEKESQANIKVMQEEIARNQQEITEGMEDKKVKALQEKIAAKESEAPKQYKTTSIAQREATKKEKNINEWKEELAQITSFKVEKERAISTLINKIAAEEQRISEIDGSILQNKVEQSNVLREISSSLEKSDELSEGISGYNEKAVEFGKERARNARIVTIEENKQLKLSEEKDQANRDSAEIDQNNADLLAAKQKEQSDKDYAASPEGLEERIKAYKEQVKLFREESAKTTEMEKVTTPAAIATKRQEISTLQATPITSEAQGASILGGISQKESEIKDLSAELVTRKRIRKEKGAQLTEEKKGIDEAKGGIGSLFGGAEGGPWGMAAQAGQQLLQTFIQVAREIPVIQAFEESFKAVFIGVLSQGVQPLAAGMGQWLMDFQAGMSKGMAGMNMTSNSFAQAFAGTGDMFGEIVAFGSDFLAGILTPIFEIIKSVMPIVKIMMAVLMPIGNIIMKTIMIPILVPLKLIGKLISNVQPFIDMFIGFLDDIFGYVENIFEYGQLDKELNKTDKERNEIMEKQLDLNWKNIEQLKEQGLITQEQFDYLSRKRDQFNKDNPNYTGDNGGGGGEGGNNNNNNGVPYVVRIETREDGSIWEVYSDGSEKKISGGGGEGGDNDNGDGTDQNSTDAFGQLITDWWNGLWGQGETPAVLMDFDSLITKMDTSSNALSLTQWMGSLVADMNTAPNALSLTQWMGSLIGSMNTSSFALTLSQNMGSLVANMNTSSFALTLSQNMGSLVANMNTATSALGLTQNIGSLVSTMNTSTSALSLTQNIGSLVSTMNTATSALNLTQNMNNLVLSLNSVKPDGLSIVTNLTNLMKVAPSSSLANMMTDIKNMVSFNPSQGLVSVMNGLLTFMGLKPISWG